VIDTGSDVTVVAAVRATAVTSWDPSETLVESHTTAYGTVESSAPTSVPSIWNWTPNTPSPVVDASRDTEEPDTVEPATGADTDTVGSGGEASTCTLENNDSPAVAASSSIAKNR
jgi:hypothetical protein